MYGGRDQANAGRIMGIIGTVLLVLGVLVADRAHRAARRPPASTSAPTGGRAAEPLERAADQHRLVDEPDAEPRLDPVADLAGQREQVGGASRRRGW